MLNIVKISNFNEDVLIAIAGISAKYSTAHNVLTYTQRHGVFSREFNSIVEACKFLMELSGVAKNIVVFQQ